ncbi:Flp pilus assembly complex ATPase component TadA [Patescibacteria group bacterium]|nr:Flp pilus assembly complex ATPase component TadA [Patescibacteria group bacterium]
MEEVRPRISKEIEISPTKLAEIQKEIKNIPEFKKKIEEFLTGRVGELLEIILGGAISLDASDIHIEPEENQTKIRLRVDGVLQDVLVFQKKIYKTLLSRIKLLSGIKLNITDRPQDGRFSILLDETPRPKGARLAEAVRPNKGRGSPGAAIEIRASALPAEYGESIVMRILDPKSLIEIEALGLRKDLLQIFKKEIKKPNGMIVVTGPTGSGKTTTLYAFLKKIHQPEIKIITIEDPIEYHLEGVSQTQVNPKKGYDFASGLRSIMRQDPDVVLVGEIRDLETAQIALQAALTGHLVLTTLHTNDAAGTVARLQALGEKPVNIAPAINMAIAQRLVRKVCQNCVRFVPISSELLKKIKKELKVLPKKIKIPELKEGLKIPQAKGCKDCNFTGFRGRIGIYESFFIDDEMEKFILTSPSISALRELATKKGMISMYCDGLIKFLKGITTLEEVERVTGE